MAESVLEIFPSYGLGARCIYSRIHGNIFGLLSKLVIPETPSWPSAEASECNQTTIMSGKIDRKLYIANREAKDPYSAQELVNLKCGEQLDY